MKSVTTLPCQGTKYTETAVVEFKAESGYQDVIILGLPCIGGAFSAGFGFLRAVLPIITDGEIDLLLFRSGVLSSETGLMDCEDDEF
jgi:hypothetical protein